MPYDASPLRYDSTEYHRVGHSGLKLPAISLGLWNNFGDDRPRATQRAILRRAFDLGIIHRVVAPEQLEEATFALADIVAAQQAFLTKQHVGKIVLTV